VIALQLHMIQHDVGMKLTTWSFLQLKAESLRQVKLDVGGKDVVGKVCGSVLRNASNSCTPPHPGSLHMLRVLLHLDSTRASLASLGGTIDLFKRERRDGIRGMNSVQLTIETFFIEVSVSGPPERNSQSGLDAWRQQDLCGRDNPASGPRLRAHTPGLRSRWDESRTAGCTIS
jgi:hypothetical protein